MVTLEAEVKEVLRLSGASNEMIANASLLRLSRKPVAEFKEEKIFGFPRKMRESPEEEDD